MEKEKKIHEKILIEAHKGLADIELVSEQIFTDRFKDVIRAISGEIENSDQAEKNVVDLLDGIGKLVKGKDAKECLMALQLSLVMWINEREPAPSSVMKEKSKRTSSNEIHKMNKSESMDIQQGYE